jgi:hypothetical protein
MRCFAIGGVLGFAAMICLTASATAQNAAFPTKPIRMIDCEADRAEAVGTSEATGGGR